MKKIVKKLLKNCDLVKGKTNGFTLAETLITLGIIGIVAALTIPTLMKTYQEIVTKRQFEKQYYTLQQAYKIIEQRQGYVPKCYYWSNSPYKNNSAICASYNDNGDCVKHTLKDGSPLPSDYNGGFSDCKYFQNEMKKTLKVTKTCKNNAYAGGCIPKYKGVDDLNRDKYPDYTDYDVNKSTSGVRYWRQNEIEKNREAWVLADGSIILFYSQFQYFAIDINGKKGPNKWGYDLFGFITRGDGHSPLYLDGLNYVEKGGLKTLDMIKSLKK